MPNDNSTMGERFDEEFPHPDVRGIFEGGDPYQMRRNAIKSFVQSEIDRAVGEKEQEIIWMIEDLAGFPADLISMEQATAIINQITRPE